MVLYLRCFDGTNLMLPNHRTAMPALTEFKDDELLDRLQLLQMAEVVAAQLPHALLSDLLQSH